MTVGTIVTRNLEQRAFRNIAAVPVPASGLERQPATR